MTDLTEQYTNGNLQDGEEYYIENKDGEVFTMHLYNDTIHWHSFKVKKQKVLAPVPSYEELQNQAFILKSRESEITKLKGLLKDCVEYVKKDYGDYLTYTQSAIYQEIKQVLGEE